MIMPTANSPASKEVVTAALLVIGGKILSGRTKDQNIGYVAEYLTAVGVDLKEVRVVGEEERAIVDALNALRHRYTYIFTTGGIGPTHGDIATDCVAKAFGVPIETDPRALAILHEWVKTTGAEMNEARLRMTRIPKGADLILNKVSGTPGFWIGNVIVMAGVPSIMQAMLDEVSPKLERERHRSLDKDAPLSRPVQRIGCVMGCWAAFITTIAESSFRYTQVVQSRSSIDRASGPF
jgi:molybdopterin-biosynthesis enzyme MoeA-like protein